MGKNIIHISDSEAAKNFTSLLERVNEGAEVVIEHNDLPVAIVSPANARSGRLISESIALAKAHAEELGYSPTLDPEFASDLEKVIESHREPLNPPAWE